MGVIFNSALCYDLYSTYKEPFYPIDRRIKKYVITGFFGAFAMSYLADTILLKDQDFYEQFIRTLLKLEIHEVKDG